MMSENEIKFYDSKPVWVAWKNTDLTEGRGFSVPLVVAESKETAERLGAGGSVQGSDCKVTEEIAVRVDGVCGHWLVPGRIEAESKEDKRQREKREARERAIERARNAGLSDADIKAMTHE